MEIIAEIGHNWNGDIALARQMIWRAKDCGADTAKFQLYDVDKLPGIEPGSPIYWELKTSQLTYYQLEDLINECKKAEIKFLCSVFDPERVEWTEALNVERYKIASRSINDKDLIRAIALTGKPIIASLGMWDKKEFPDFKADFLYCIAKYPPKDEDLKDFPEKFDKYTGFSDHTIGTKWAKLAIDKGAKIIEKHFTLDKEMVGCDQAGSADEKELKEIVNYGRKHSN